MPYKDPVKAAEAKRKSADKNRDKRNALKRERYANDPEFRAKANQHYADHKVEILTRMKADYNADPGPKKEAAAQYRKENAERVRQYFKDLYDEISADPERKRLRYERLKKYYPQAMRSENTKLVNRIRNAIRDCLKGRKKYAASMLLLGIDVEGFKKHFESLFTGGMTWELVMSGAIHLDHKRPLNSFQDISDPEQQKIAFHYTNLQPLWAKDNLQKSDFWEGKPGKRRRKKIAIIPAPTV